MKPLMSRRLNPSIRMAGKPISRLIERMLPDGDFEWKEYLAHHSDLTHLSSRSEAFAHYRRHGKAEGRLANRRDIDGRVAIHENETGTCLPQDFDWRWYIECYEDLNSVHASYLAAEHFLKHGAKEGRLPFRFEPELYKSLYFAQTAISTNGLLDHYRLVGRERGYIGNSEQLTNSEGCRSWRWVGGIDVEEFSLLNGAWAGTIRNKRDALRAMLREGVARLAPLSFSVFFDPGYYREANPSLASLSDEALHEEWLFSGMERGRPGNAQAHLASLGFKSSAYPSGFDWQSHADRPGARSGNKWACLDLLVGDARMPAELIPVHGEGACDFLAALALAVSGDDAGRADRIYAVAARRGRLAPEHVEDWGHVLMRLDDWPRASSCFQHVLGAGAARASTVAAAAEALINSGEPRAAILVLSSPDYHAGGDIHVRYAISRAIECEYAQSRILAEHLYRRGRRQDADDLLAAVVSDIADWWQRLDPIGVALPPVATDRVVLLANVDLRQCTHYRVNQKREVFERAGLKLEVFAQDDVLGFLDALPGAKAAIFYRLPATPTNVRAILYARALGMPTLYDIDDLIFDAEHYPEPIETYGGLVSEAFYCSLQMGVPLFRAAMSLCDMALASTTALAASMEPVVRSGRAFVLPNGLDSHNEPYLDLSIPRVRRSSDVVLFYGSGTKAHNADFLDLAGDALAELMQADPSIKLIIMGYLALDERFESLNDRIVFLDWSKDIESYWSVLREADINLAVLASAPTTDCKSEIKWLEAAALGLPSIVSSTHRYREVLEDGTDCLMAANAGEWREALRRLVYDVELRRGIAAKARAKARALYSLDANASRLRDIIGQLEKPDGLRVPPARKRLLLVNIFFPPQTIGGSTRIAKENLDHFLESGLAQAYDFAVLTTDDGNPDALRLRVDDYRGVPVFRISPPITELMEWNVESFELGELYGTILDTFRPDLVHVHSIQRFTLEILKECLRRAIPYINTIHDGWWVSDYTFLTDRKGRPRSPEEDLPLGPPDEASVGEALDRRRQLRMMLNASQRILVVSDAFTQLMRQAGYDRAISVPNGTPAMPKVDRTRHPHGKVRIAQISGFTHHKGFHYVQAAFKIGRFRNIELTLLDHQRFGGRVDRVKWGETDVRIIGKTRLETMHTFYAEQDVLIVPSIWPESFGLVAREATAAGLWVIASDRGAIGEGIAHGVNGWVIGVETLQPLLGVLQEIDDDPRRFAASPPPAGTPARNAADQARDVAAIYDEVINNPLPTSEVPYFLQIEDGRRSRALRQDIAAAEEKLARFERHRAR